MDEASCKEAQQAGGPVQTSSTTQYDLDSECEGISERKQKGILEKLHVSKAMLGQLLVRDQELWWQKRVVRDFGTGNSPVVQSWSCV